MTVRAGARVGLSLSNHRLAIAAADEIDREHDDRCARTLGALDHLLCSIPVLLVIQLKPDWRAARGDHVLDARRGHRRQNLEMILGFGGASHGNLTLRMK